MKNLNPPILLTALFILFNTGCQQKTIPDLREVADASKIEALYPTIDCPVVEARPTFSWTKLRTIRRNVKYQLMMVAMKDKQDSRTAMEKNTKLIDVKDIEATSLSLPATVKDLRPNTMYAYQIVAYEEKGETLSKSDVSLFYRLDNKLPDFFQDLLCCEQNMFEKPIMDWKIAYGAPGINEEALGCFNSKGTIEMSGSRMAGDAVYQNLAETNKIKAGNYYQISFCAKQYSKEIDYVRFRFLAYNGALPSTGTHPETSANITVIGESGDIKSNDWNRYFLSSWKAPKDYDHVAVLMVTNENTTPATRANGSISNICMQITDDCGLTASDIGFSNDGTASGEVNDYLEEETDPEFIDIDYGQGKMTDLYGNPFDEQGNNNWYNLNDECISIGGEIPHEAEDSLKKHLEYKLPGGISLEEFDEGMQTFFEKFGKEMKYPDWGPIPKEKENDCKLQYDKTKPFNGRDIIYVHGLVLDHVLKRSITNDPTGFLRKASEIANFADNDELTGVAKSWPDDKEAFFKDGFYHDMADSYFDDHIDHFLGDHNNPSNRYMLVAFNSSQPLIENVHAALTQIALAMNEGTGVIHPKDDARGTSCFGKEVVIISHSTGGLLMDVALAMAGMSTNDDDIQKAFGDIQYIAKRTKAHVALHGALAGSELAALAVFGANLSAVAATGADIGIDVNIAVNNATQTGYQIAYDAVTGMNTATTSNNTDALEAFLDAATDSLVVLTRSLASTFNNSVLVDLSPITAKLKWRNYINQIKVPVMTVAGGHPGNVDEKLFTKIILPGFDDGVVSANSQSGSPSSFHPDLYQYLPPESRIFMLGIDLRRSVPYFSEQSKGVFGAAYGSIPFLSPAGMVQPVAAFAAPSPRYTNHYPFLQSASEHMHSFSNDLTYVGTAGATNREECLVLENGFLFSSGLVHPSIATLVSRQIKGQDLVITFSLTYPVVNSLAFPPAISWATYSFSITIPLWRRTYDTLSGNNPETHFVYNFVL